MRRPRIFEDFVPISNREALITTGDRFDRLNQVERVPYFVDADGLVHPAPRGVPLTQGKYVRLGGLFDGELVYSEGHDGPHQTCIHEGARYYTDDWPHVRIYRDGEVYLDHFGDMVQVGNPFWGGGVMYFEARADDHPERPELWEVWKRAPRKDPEFVCQGANPAWWDGRLFVGTWNGSGFSYRRMG